jgi:hypothetical protein
MKQTVGVGLLLLSGCEVARGARDDFARLTSSQPAPTQVRKKAPSQATAPARNGPAAEPTAAAKDAPAIDLAGTSEDKLRALLGPPTSEEDHPPGKQWQYRDGKCTLDVQLYPDVRTKQFGTLAYKVKSDDNTDEGQRLCMARLQSRLQARR